jgi:hypothetical protein
MHQPTPYDGGGDLLGLAHPADRLLGDDGGAAFLDVAGRTSGSVTAAGAP